MEILKWKGYNMHTEKSMVNTDFDQVKERTEK